MQLLTLIKAALAGTTWFSKGAILELKQRRQLWLLPLAGTGIAAGVAFFAFLLTRNYRALYLLGLQIGAPELVFFYALLAGWAL